MIPSSSAPATPVAPTRRAAAPSTTAADPQPPRSLSCGHATAPTLGLRDYLLETWHPNTRPESIDPEPGLRWTGLTIEHSGAGKAWDDEGMVAFSATWEEGDRTGTMREVSSFLQVDGRWFYVNGIPHTPGHHAPEEHEKT